MTPWASEMASLSNSRWQNYKERSNRSRNNRDIAERVIRYVVREGVSDTLVRELLKRPSTSISSEALTYGQINLKYSHFIKIHYSFRRSSSL